MNNFLPEDSKRGPENLGGLEMPPLLPALMLTKGVNPNVQRQFPSLHNFSTMNITGESNPKLTANIIDESNPQLIPNIPIYTDERNQPSISKMGERLVDCQICSCLKGCHKMNVCCLDKAGTQDWRDFNAGIHVSRISKRRGSRENSKLLKILPPCPYYYDFST